jgi:hypothetical protein
VHDSERGEEEHMELRSLVGLMGSAISLTVPQTVGIAMNSG